MTAAGSSPATDHATTFQAELPRLLPRLRAFVRGFGIGSRYAEDLAQDVVLAVWVAIQNGGYCPAQGAKPGDAISMFAFGVASHRALDLVKSAAYRRERLPADTTDDDEFINTAVDRRTLRNDERLEAREILRRVEHLRPEHREVLGMVGEGQGVQIRHRLRMAREAFGNLLDTGARRSVWRKAPRQPIKRQRSGPRAEDEEDEGPEYDVCPVAISF